jgi:hypothetical protein
MTRRVSPEGRLKIAEAQRRRRPMGAVRRCAALAPVAGCTGTFAPRAANQKRCHVCCAADPVDLRGNKVRRGTMAPDGTPITKSALRAELQRRSA